MLQCWSATKNLFFKSVKSLFFSLRHRNMTLQEAKPKEKLEYFLNPPQPPVNISIPSQQPLLLEASRSAAMSTTLSLFPRSSRPKPLWTNSWSSLIQTGNALVSGAECLYQTPAGLTAPPWVMSPLHAVIWKLLACERLLRASENMAAEDISAPSRQDEGTGPRPGHALKKDL